MVADRKYKDAINFKNHARLIFAVNKLPVSLHKDAGYYTRVVIITFNNMFVMNPDPADPRQMKADSEKIDRIMEIEKSGILNWMIEGLQRLLKNGELTIPGSSKSAIVEYEKTSNPLHHFVEDCCELQSTSETNRSKIYDRYHIWCAWNGYKRLSAGNFYDHMIDDFDLTQVRRPDERRLRGIKLK